MGPVAERHSSGFHSAEGRCSDMKNDVIRSFANGRRACAGRGLCRLSSGKRGGCQGPGAQRSGPFRPWVRTILLRVKPAASSIHPVVLAFDDTGADALSTMGLTANRRIGDSDFLSAPLCGWIESLGGSLEHSWVGCELPDTDSTAGAARAEARRGLGHRADLRPRPRPGARLRIEHRRHPQEPRQRLGSCPRRSVPSARNSPCPGRRPPPTGSVEARPFRSSTSKGSNARTSWRFGRRALPRVSSR